MLRPRPLDSKVWQHIQGAILPVMQRFRQFVNAQLSAQLSANFTTGASISCNFDYFPPGK